MKLNRGRFARLRKYVPTARKAFRRTGKAGRSNRIFRRFIRRTAIKPELKHVDTFTTDLVGYTGSGVGTPISRAITPITLAQGATVITRTGNQLKFVKVDIRIILQDNSGVTGATAPDHPSYLARVVIWTARTTQAAANASAQNISTTSLIDYDALTVMRDMTVLLQPNYIDVGATAALNAGGISQRLLKCSVKFPRNVHFSGNNTDIDPTKDIMYMTVIPQANAGIGFNHFTSTRVWFFDV